MSQVQFGFKENSPATGAAPATIERPVKGSANPGAGDSVPRRRSRGGVQIAVEDFGDQVFRDLQQVVIGGRPNSPIGLRHGTTIACGSIVRRDEVKAPPPSL